MDLQPRRVREAYPRLRTRRGRSRGRKALIAILAVALVGGSLGVAAIATNTLGAGRLYERFVAKVDRFLAGPPPPDRVTEETVVVTPEAVADRDTVAPPAGERPARGDAAADPDADPAGRRRCRHRPEPRLGVRP